MSRFDDAAKRWDLNPRRVETARAVCGKILKIVDVRGFDILDYGCGTGLVSFGLFEYAKSITAMDNSKGMIKELNKKAAVLKIDNIKTVLHDIEKEKLPKNSFDMIVSSMTLHHIKKPEMFFQKAKTALRNGGYLAISDLFEEDGSFHSHGNEGVHHFGFSKKRMKKLYQDNGFEILFLDTVYIVKKAKEYKLFLAMGKVT